MTDTDRDYVEEVFGASGLLAARFEGYEPREGQLALARAVDASFARGENLLAEAPTGTGKSLAYAVPAVYHATQRGKRVVIVTANIALQEQLVGKDLPLLRSLLPWPFQYALAKGRANYLCRDAFDDARAEMILMKPSDPREAAQWAEVVAWADRTEAGDISELPFEPLHVLRPKFTVSSDECLGKSCGSYDECHANRAYRAMQSAHVVVTNYHMLFAHLVVARDSDGNAGLLPPFDLVVFDEGHKAADIAREFFGFRVTAGGLRWLARLLAGGGKKSKKGPLEEIDLEFKKRYEGEVERFVALLRGVHRSPDYKARLKEPPRSDSWQGMVDVLRQAEALYLHTAATRPLATPRKMELMKVGLRCGLVANCVVEAMTIAKPHEAVYFIEEDDRGRCALISKPVHVDATLRSMLFDSADVDGVAVLSATLRTGSSFSFVAGELGTGGSRKTAELVAPTPFDFEQQAILVVPHDLPEPNAREFPAEVAEVVAGAVERAGGRTLGLFTSYKNLDVAYDRLERQYRGQYRVLRQGEAPRTQLIRAFREDVTSVLLGTESFWQGVDVPGPALSCVVIDKLPFATPDDPICDAVQDEDPKGWFKRYSLPRAIIAFRQGFGRLIRTTTDRGVVVVCDRRLVDKGYGRSFVRALPEVRLERSLDAIGPWLARRTPPVTSNRPRERSAPPAVEASAFGRDVDEGLRAILEPGARVRRSAAGGTGRG